MFPIVKTFLSEALQGKLPGISAHERMLPPGRHLIMPYGSLSVVKRSSVLLLLFPENGKIYTCLTKRPMSMRHHPGQISFPGGKVEDGDLSDEMTALREAKEEIGLDGSAVEVLGRLSVLYVEASRFSICPVVAWAEQRPKLSVDENEVEKLVFFPVDDFLANETILDMDVDTNIGLLRVKYYPCEGETIWGATAMILAELIEVLRQGQAVEGNA